MEKKAENPVVFVCEEGGVRAMLILTGDVNERQRSTVATIFGDVECELFNCDQH